MTNKNNWQIEHEYQAALDSLNALRDEWETERRGRPLEEQIKIDRVMKPVQDRMAARLEATRAAWMAVQPHVED